MDKQNISFDILVALKICDSNETYLEACKTSMMELFVGNSLPNNSRIINI